MARPFSFTAEKARRIVELARIGATQEEAARAVGVTRSTVARWLRDGNNQKSRFADFAREHAEAVRSWKSRRAGEAPEDASSDEQEAPASEFSQWLENKAYHDEPQTMEDAPSARFKRTLAPDGIVDDEARSTAYRRLGRHPAGPIPDSQAVEVPASYKRVGATTGNIDWLSTIRCPDCGSDAVSSELAKLPRIVGVLIEA